MSSSFQSLGNAGRSGSAALNFEPSRLTTGRYSECGRAASSADVKAASVACGWACASSIRTTAQVQSRLSRDSMACNLAVRRAKSVSKRDPVTGCLSCCKGCPILLSGTNPSKYRGRSMIVSHGARMNSEKGIACSVGVACHGFENMDRAHVSARRTAMITAISDGTAIMCGKPCFQPRSSVGLRSVFRPSSRLTKFVPDDRSPMTW